MARKLLVMVALMGLVSLIQAPPGSADTYYQFDSPGDIFWMEVHGPGGDPGFVPGYANGSIMFFGPGIFLPLTYNSADATLTPVASGPDSVTYTIVYDTLNSSGNQFTSNFGGIDITSTDTVMATTATYYKDTTTGLPSFTMGTDGFEHYTLTDNTMHLTGYGHNSDGTYFILEGTMLEENRDGQHSGYFSSLTLTYPATEAADPSAVPIPGAVWLLGTGLLGLGCVGRRRRP